MTDVSFARIGELCQVGDGTHSKIPRQESGILYLTSRNFKDGGVDLSSVYYISEENFEKHFEGNGKALAKPEYGDLVFSIIGTIGEPYLVRRGDKFGLSSSVAIVRPDKTVIDPEFLFYWFKGPKFQQALFGIKGGVAQGYVSLEMIRSLPVPQLPLPRQRRIAGILSGYDELIENNQRRIKILEEMGRSLYREWFVNFRFPGHEKVPLVDSPLGPIPKGWEIARVGELLQKVPQQEKIKAKDYLPLGPLAVVDQGREFIGGYTDNVDASYSSDLPVIVFGDHTRVLKYIDFPFACGADGTQLLRSRSERMPMSLFFYALSAIELSNFAYARHFKFLKEQQLPLPDIQTALSFAGAVDSFREKISSLQKINDNLRHTRDLLLPKLISGEIRLKDRHRDTEVVSA
jgi:type I restriction enzyme, S subunit